MKKLFYTAVLLIAIALLTACTQESGSANDGSYGQIGDSFRMLATVENIGDRIEVNVTESEYASGIYWVITADATEYFDEKGKEISRESLSVGDTVEILYSGQVMMSYPPQIVAARISIKSN